ncbi:lyase family protein [Nocardia australiensis]|uniref:lyase family protein n=1 Tax=Nocardia australiensis TaxID=2887191 RepID=UPI00355626DE
MAAVAGIAYKFEVHGGLDGIVAAAATLRGLAVTLMKIADDIRWLASGPRTGIGELTLPANEPGSSIMPGKVNPAQREAMVMVCIQVIGEDCAIAHNADRTGLPLCESSLDSGFISAEDFDAVVNPATMIGPF